MQQIELLMLQLADASEREKNLKKSHALVVEALNAKLGDHE